MSGPAPEGSRTFDDLLRLAKRCRAWRLGAGDGAVVEREEVRADLAEGVDAVLVGEGADVAGDAARVERSERVVLEVADDELDGGAEVVRVRGDGGAGDARHQRGGEVPPPLPLGGGEVGRHYYFILLLPYRSLCLPMF